jgi:multicomponent Na+:H+ antiporter subunit D
VDYMQFPLIILFVLLLGAVLTPLLMKRFNQRGTNFILGVLIVSLSISGYLLFQVMTQGSYMYNVGNWSPTIGIQFSIDAFSTMMVFFILLMSTLVVVYSLRDIEHEILPKQIPVYYSLIFLLLVGMVGITFTNDLFNTYVFMEILAMTSCAIISIKRKKENFMAAFKYLMLNTLASISFLFGVALLYMGTGYLNITEMANQIPVAWELYPTNILLALGFMAAGLGIKAAVFPMHTWLPDAHSSAPTPSSALLSGLVVKVYIFVTMKILFRLIGTEIIIVNLGLHNYIAYFAAVGMVMGSIFAIGQKDIKRMLAYSSVAQLGYIFLGIGLATSAGIGVSLFHVVSHGLMKSALFLSAGAVIYKTDKRKISDLSGIGYEMPITMVVFSIAALGMIGIPGMSGFMSKWYLALAVLEANQPFYLVVILLSSFLNAVYYLPIIVSAFLKPREDGSEEMTRDGIPRTMTMPMIIIAGFIILVGIFPQILMNIIERAVPTFL